MIILGQAMPPEWELPGWGQTDSDLQAAGTTEDRTVFVFGICSMEWDRSLCPPREHEGDSCC